jgi:GDPmannose 4,6-dehydratase
MWLMLQQSDPADYVVATGETHRLEDFVAAAFEEVGLDWRRHVVSDPGLRRPNEVMTSRANPGKAAASLGWRARHRMRDVVRDMIRSARPRNGFAAN